MGNKRSMLLVEDNPMDVKIFKLIFAELPEKPEIVVATNGSEALEYLMEAYLGNNMPDLVLSDLNMPMLNGLEFLERVKMDRRFFRTPVIIYSGSVNQSDIQRAYELRAAAYVQKSFNIDTLRQSMEILFQFWFDTAALPRLLTNEKN
jgi:two-component system response regulator